MQNICVRCRNVYEVMRSSVLNFLPDLCHLEVHYFQVKGEKIRDIGDGLTIIV